MMGLQQRVLHPYRLPADRTTQLADMTRERLVIQEMGEDRLGPPGQSCGRFSDRGFAPLSAQKLCS